MNTSRLSEIKSLLRRHGLRVFLSLLLLLLFYMSYTISREPVSSGLAAAPTCARYILPVVALLSIVLAVLKRYFTALSLFIGYHLGFAFAIVGAEDSSVAVTTVILTLAAMLLVGVWLEIFSVLLAKWKKEADTAAQ